MYTASSRHQQPTSKKRALRNANARMDICSFIMHRGFHSRTRRVQKILKIYDQHSQHGDTYNLLIWSTMAQYHPPKAKNNLSEMQHLSPSSQPLLPVHSYVHTSIITVYPSLHRYTVYYRHGMLVFSKKNYTM